MQNIEKNGEALSAESANVKPSDGEKPHKKKNYEIDIFRGWCKSCGICAGFCPRECLSLDADGTPVVSDSTRCTGCGWCEMHCPDFAISIRERNCLKTPSEEA